MIFAKDVSVWVEILLVCLFHLGLGDNDRNDDGGGEQKVSWKVGWSSMDQVWDLFVLSDGATTFRFVRNKSSKIAN